MYIFFTFILVKKFFVVTFLGSIIWIAAYSYLMVWWATVAGKTIGIPDTVSKKKKARWRIEKNLIHTCPFSF